MSGPTAAKGSFPYKHRTVEQVWFGGQDLRYRRLRHLEAIANLRSLSDFESRKMERLLRRLPA